MGADSSVVLDGVRIETPISKIVSLPHRDLTIGVAGCVLASQLLRHEFKVPRQPVHMTGSDYIRAKLAPEIRGLFKQAEVPDCALLVVFDHELYVVSGLMEVVQRKCLTDQVQFDAIGSGARVALGASWIGYQVESNRVSDTGWMRSMVELSLRAAHEFDQHVCAPYVVVEV